MNGKEIYEQLLISDRWGTNDQPSIFLMVSVLELMSISNIAVSSSYSDRVQIQFSESIDVKDRWIILTMLNPDELFYSKEDSLIDLWWD